MYVNRSERHAWSCVTLLLSERYEGVDAHRSPGRQPARSQCNDQEQQGRASEGDQVDRAEAIEVIRRSMADYQASFGGLADLLSAALRG